MKTEDLDRLLKLLSQLNPSAGEIGPGMLAQICSLVQSSSIEVQQLKDRLILSTQK